MLDRLFESVRLPSEVLVVVDSADDTTVPVAEEYAQKEPRLRCLVNTYGRGPANAIRFGIDAATAPVVVVTMADGCDDARQIDELVRLVERGVAVAAASRYMPGGQQVGGPVIKGMLSRTAGRSLRSSRASAPGTPRTRSRPTPRVRAAGGHRLPGRVRDRHRADRKGEADAPAGGRDPHDLAGPAGRDVEFQDREVGAQVPPLVPFRVRTAADRRSGAAPRRGQPTGAGAAGRSTRVLMEQVLVSGSAGFIGGYVVEELLNRSNT